MRKLLIVDKNPIKRKKFSALLQLETTGWEHCFTDTLVNMEQLLLIHDFEMVVLAGKVALHTTQDYINNLSAQYPSTAILVSCNRKNELSFGNQNQDMFIRMFIKIIDKLENFETYSKTIATVVEKELWENIPIWSDN